MSATVTGTSENGTVVGSTKEDDENEGSWGDPGAEDEEDGEEVGREEYCRVMVWKTVMKIVEGPAPELALEDSEDALSVAKDEVAVEAVKEEPEDDSKAEDSEEDEVMKEDEEDEVLVAASKEKEIVGVAEELASSVD